SRRRRVVSACEVLCQDFGKALRGKAAQLGNHEATRRRVTAAAELLRDLRQIDIAIRTAAQTHALAPKIEQRDYGLSGIFVEMRGDLAAIAETARGPDRYSIAQRLIDESGFG